MKTIRAFTTIEQSRKLAEILPMESADMCYMYIGAKYKEYQDFPIYAPAMERDLCAWSLAALLGVLKDYTLQTNTDRTVFIVYEGKKPIISDFFNNPVDACVAMVEKLHELNLL